MGRGAEHRPWARRLIASRAGKGRRSLPVGRPGDVLAHSNLMGCQDRDLAVREPFSKRTVLAAASCVWLCWSMGWSLGR